MKARSSCAMRTPYPVNATSPYHLLGMAWRDPARGKVTKERSDFWMSLSQLLPPKKLIQLKKRKRAGGDAARTPATASAPSSTSPADDPGSRAEGLGRSGRACPA